jgi:hypothetical protein
MEPPSGICTGIPPSGLLPDTVVGPDLGTGDAFGLALASPLESARSRPA